MSAAAPMRRDESDQELDRRLRAIDRGLEKVHARVRSGELAGADTPTKGFRPDRVRHTKGVMTQLAAESRAEHAQLKATSRHRTPREAPPPATPCAVCGTTHLLDGECKTHRNGNGNGNGAGH